MALIKSARVRLIAGGESITLHFVRLAINTLRKCLRYSSGDAAFLAEIYVSRVELNISVEVKTGSRQDP